MDRDTADKVADALQARGHFARVANIGTNRIAVRIALPDGREVLWDADGAAGLEAQVMRDGDLVGFVPVIPGSADFDVEQAVAAIDAADYGAG